MHVTREEYPWWEGDIDEALSDMNEAGIGNAVIVQLPYHRYDHSYACLAKNSHPGIFAITGLADSLAPDIGDTLQGLKKTGIQGVRISVGDGEMIGEKAGKSLWTSAAELKVPILLQICPCHFKEVHQVAADYPQTIMLIDHVAHIAFDADMKETLKVFMELADKKNLFVKTSHLYGLNRSMGEEANIKAALAEIKAAYGADRMMFGSNWPLVRKKGGLTRCVDHFLEALEGFSQEEKEWILWRTAESIYEFN